MVTITQTYKCTCYEGTASNYRKGCPVHDPEVRAAVIECANCADLRRQLENAKLSEGYALQTVANLHKEVAELQVEIHRARTDSTYWSEFNTIANNRCVCVKCGQPHDPKLHGDGQAALRREE